MLQRYSKMSEASPRRYVLHNAFIIVRWAQHVAELVGEYSARSFLNQNEGLLIIKNFSAVIGTGDNGIVIVALEQKSGVVVPATTNPCLYKRSAEHDMWRTILLTRCKYFELFEWERGLVLSGSCFFIAIAANSLFEVPGYSMFSYWRPWLAYFRSTVRNGVSWIFA